MSDEVPEEVPPSVPAVVPDEPEGLPPLTAIEADYVRAITQMIADARNVPGEPGTAWAGRADIVALVIKELGATPEQAEMLVTRTQHELYAGRDDPKQVAIKLLRARLSQYSEMVKKWRKDDPQIETTYEYVDQLDPRTQQPIIDPTTGHPKQTQRFKKKKVTRPSMGAMIRLQLEIDDRLMRLDGLADTTNDPDTSIAAIFTQMRREIDGTKTEKAVFSVKNLTQAGIDKFQAVLKEIDEGAHRKTVESREVNGAGE